MGSRSTGYNNEAYWNQYDEPDERGLERGGDAVHYYQSYNETFVDDETCFQNYVKDGQCTRADYEQRLQDSSGLNESFSSETGPRRRLSACFSVSNGTRISLNESFPASNDPRNRLYESVSTINDPKNRLYETVSTNNNSRSRLNESYSTGNDQRNRFNECVSTSNDPRNRFNESFSASNDPRKRFYESVSTSNDPRNRFNESFSTSNDHRSRLNESFSTSNDSRSRLNEPISQNNSPRKSNRRERSSSAPGRRSTMDVFAPMVAQCQDFPTIRRSRSTIRLPRDVNPLSPTLQRRPTRSNSTKTISTYPQTPRNVHSNSFSQSTPQRPLMPNIVAIRPERLHSFDSYCGQEMVETSLLSPELKRRVTPIRKPSSNLAIIPPNCRNKSAVPLLANSPAKFHTRDSELGDRSPTKGSWLHLPSQHGKPESFWLAGMVLLITGFAICVLCFFLLSKKRKSHSFFLELGAVSGFVSFVLGFLGFRTNSYSGDWLPNRNYMSGYIILILLNLLQCGVLSILSSGWRGTVVGSPEEDIACGAIGGLAVLTLLLSVLGLGTSMCCKNPPPDNRVAHCAQGFIV